jgi:hypothetical protein
VTIFYCVRFETSLFVASYDSQGHGGGVRTGLHTGRTELLPESRYITSALTMHRKPGSIVAPGILRCGQVV